MANGSGEYQFSLEAQEKEHELEIKLNDILSSIRAIKERQEQTCEAVRKVNEGLYEPDKGLFSRVRSVEAWKESSAKFYWTLITSIVALIGTLVGKFLL